MLEFKKIDKESINELRALSKKCPYLDSVYSPGQLLMWNDMAPAAFTVNSGCLIIRIDNGGEMGYLYPYPVVSSGDVNEALVALEEHMEETSDRLRFISVSNQQRCELAARYTNFNYYTDRSWADYIYRTEELAGFFGRHYSGQRNHIKHFLRNNPKAVFRLLKPGDEEALLQFWEEYEPTAYLPDEEAVYELSHAKETVTCKCDEYVYNAGVFSENRLLGICSGEVYGSCTAVHIEKGLPTANGIYPYMVNAFASLMLGKTEYMNREDDAGNRGLRISKLQYRPCELLIKSILTVGNELALVKKRFSEMSEGSVLIQGSGGLSLRLMSEKDSEDYDRLCLDDEHNSMWGYDYRKDCESPEPGYFLRDARESLMTETALSVAVYQGESFIGEAVYFVFNGRGSCKLGWRLLPEYCGKNLSAEVFKMAGDFGLYDMGLSKITAYCYKENIPSARAIAHSMKEIGSDEKYIHFERTV